jgi:hypothetical protein
MNREDAKNYEYDLDVDGYYHKDVEEIIDKIYDHFEAELNELKNRTCEGCEYAIDDPTVNGYLMCTNTVSSCQDLVNVLPSFGCNLWKKKNV